MKNNYQFLILCLLLTIGLLSFAANAPTKTSVESQTSTGLLANLPPDDCLFFNPIADLPWLSDIFANVSICGCAYPNGVSQYIIDGQTVFVLQQYYSCEVPPISIQNVYDCSGSVVCQIDTSPTADPNTQTCILGNVVNTWTQDPDPFSLPWLANIANNADGCGVAQIVDLGVYYGSEPQYWGQHLFATAAGYGLLCPTDLPFVVYNCSGEQVCINGFLPADAPQLCNNVLPGFDMSSGTLIWEYQAPTEPCICPLIYAPVCGSNGVTYDNSCFAECAGVSFTEGECGTEPTNCEIPNNLVISNLVAQIDCSICTQSLDWYCDGTNSIIVLTTSGMCADFPTYYYDSNGNEICTQSGYPPIGYVSACDTLIDLPNLVFQQNLWSCSPNICVCPEYYSPVCGSDGITYDNPCFAECAGVSWTEGTCGTTTLCDLVDLIPPADSVVQNIIAEYPCDVCGWQLDWYCNNGQTLLQVSSVPYTLPDGSMVQCFDIPTYYYDATGNQICYSGGLIGGTCTDTSGIDFANLIFQQTLWGCNGIEPPPCTPNTYGTIVERCGQLAIQLTEDTTTYYFPESISLDASQIGQTIYFAGTPSDMVDVCGGGTLYFIIDCYEIINGGCLCPEYYSPVCGSDGITYNNSCFAECAGVSFTEGECGTNPSDTTYYSYTICAGESILIGFTDGFMVGNTIYNWSPDQGQLSCYDNQCRAIWVAPTQNTNYLLDVFTTIGMTHEYYQYNITINQNCDTTALPCGVALSNLEWLNNLIAQGNTQNPNDCSALLGIYTGTFNGETVIYAQYNLACDAVSYIYSCDGTVICTFGGLIPITDCAEPTNLSPIWLPNTGCICPEIYAPVCGPDGQVYSNSCFAECEGVYNWTDCNLVPTDTLAMGLTICNTQAYTQNLGYFGDEEGAGISTLPNNGTASISFAPDFSQILTYTPNAGFVGQDTFVVTASGFDIGTEQNYTISITQYIVLVNDCIGCTAPADSIVQNLASQISCDCSHSIDLYCDGNNAIMVVSGGFPCTDYPTSYYDATGNYICQSGGLMPNTCDGLIDLSNLVFVQNLSGCTVNPPCECPLDVYQPVCGSDGITYDNPCFAECAGVSWTEGECGIEPTSCDLANLTIPTDSVVQNLASQISCDCSHSIDLYCDGNNAIMVVSGGFPCTDYPTSYYDATGNYVCQSGGLMPNTCDGLIDLSNLVFVQNLSGCTVNPPCECPLDVYQPVCGSDGVTYNNACFAECAGVEWTEGECGTNPTDTTYYSYTICAGDSILIGFTDGLMIGNTIYNWSPNEGQLSCYDNQCRAIWVAPTQNTNYLLDVFTTIGMTHEYYQYNITINQNCDTTALPCGVALSDLEWLNDLIAQGNAQDPNDCSALLGIYTGTFNGETVIYAQYNNSCDAASYIYSCDGTIICTFGGLMPPGNDCEAPTDLATIWVQSLDCNCPEIYAPVCGSDGQTYSNGCFAECAGVSFTEGACGETPPLCDHPDTVYVCTPPLTTISLCPQFCFEGDYTISAISQYFSCSIFVADNCVAYTPVPLFYGNEVVTIIGCQGDVCDTIYYQIFTGICNQAPVALNDNIYIDGGNATPIYALSNDFDAENDVFSISTHTQPQNGTLSLYGDYFTYTPNAGFEGTDVFEYQVCDADGLCDAATVTIYVSNNAVVPCQNEAMHICTQPIIQQWICPEFCNLDNSDDVVITNVTSQFVCSVYLPANSNCVRYTALPLFSGTDTLQIIGCNALGVCDTVVALMHVGDCPEGGKYGDRIEEQFLNILSLSPVPSNSDLFVRFVTNQTSAQISISDLSGRIVEQANVVTLAGTAQVQRFDVGQYQAGLYLLTIQTTEGKITQGWVKQ